MTLPKTEEKRTQDVSVDLSRACPPSNGSLQKRRLRIVHTISSLKVGGMEHIVLRLAEAQQRHGHRVTILALRGGPLREQAVHLRLPVHVLGGSQKAWRAARGAFLLARLRPDIVHAHNPTSLHYALLAKTLVHARVVMTCHGGAWTDARMPDRREWQQTDAVVAVSQGTAQEVQPFDIAGKLSVIRNGVDLDTAPRDRDMLRAGLGLTNAFVGIIVARIARVKGHDTLLHALALLRDTGVRVTVLIAGDGDERANIETLARELKLGQDQIRFLGFRSDVSDLLSASDFFVLPSLLEGLSIAILEAMAHRLPIVATPVGGTPEVVTHNQQGILIPVNDPKALAGALAKLAKDVPFRASLGEAAFRRVRDEFSMETMARQYEEIYYGLGVKRLF